MAEDHALLEEAQAEVVARDFVIRAGNEAAAAEEVAQGNADEAGAPVQVPPPAAPAPAVVNGPQRRNANNVVNNNNNNPPPNAGGRVLSIALGIMARDLLSSLMAPLIGQQVARLLHRWALNGNAVGSGVMRKVLGVGMTGQVNSVRSVSKWWGMGGKGAFVPIGLRLGIEDLDPIWYVGLNPQVPSS